jgi:hypothetical protein
MSALLLLTDSFDALEGVICGSGRLENAGLITMMRAM